jgi:hypothetical protein
MWQQLVWSMIYNPDNTNDHDQHQRLLTTTTGRMMVAVTTTSVLVMLGFLVVRDRNRRTTADNTVTTTTTTTTSLRHYQSRLVVHTNNPTTTTTTLRSSSPEENLVLLRSTEEKAKKGVVVQNRQTRDDLSLSESSPYIVVAAVQQETEIKDTDDTDACAVATGSTKHGVAATTEDDDRTAERERTKLPFVAKAKQHTQHHPPFLPENDRRRHLEQFWEWCNVESSLFRIYTIATRTGKNKSATSSSNKDDASAFSAVPPYNPSSRRGTVRVNLVVTNDTDVVIDTFWIDYKGKSSSRGNIRPGETWHQTTWIDHPWVFEVNGVVWLHYVPYRVIPTIHEAVTVDVDDDPMIGIHRFTILPPADDRMVACRVEDPIFPHPSSQHLTTCPSALEWALLHAVRMQFDDWDLLLRYLYNCLQKPDNDGDGSTKYRSIRLGNRQFGPRLWQTAARGIFLAIGFSINQSHIQIGGPGEMSPTLRSEFSQCVLQIDRWRQTQEYIPVNNSQPEGADGFGRAGFGRAGAMNQSM